MTEMGPSADLQVLMAHYGERALVLAVGLTAEWQGPTHVMSRALGQFSGDLDPGNVPYWNAEAPPVALFMLSIDGGPLRLIGTRMAAPAMDNTFPELWSAALDRLDERFAVQGEWTEGGASVWVAKRAFLERFHDSCVRVVRELGAPKTRGSGNVVTVAVNVGLADGCVRMSRGLLEGHDLAVYTNR